MNFLFFSSWRRSSLSTRQSSPIIARTSPRFLPTLTWAVSVLKKVRWVTCHHHSWRSRHLAQNDSGCSNLPFFQCNLSFSHLNLKKSWHLSRFSSGTSNHYESFWSGTSKISVVIIFSTQRAIWRRSLRRTSFPLIVNIPIMAQIWSKTSPMCSVMTSSVRFSKLTLVKYLAIQTQTDRIIIKEYN